MRLYRSLILLFTVLLACAAAPAFAADHYQVEAILFRQIGEPAATPQPAPEHWDRGAPRVGQAEQRATALDATAQKLEASGKYQVLLHKAWQQTIGSEPSVMAVTEGDERFGHFAVEGTLSVAIDRFTDFDAEFWVNQLDSHGILLGSERLKQNARVKNGELTFLDYGSLALLIKVSSL
ncbi:CsiV family protein [Pseudomonas sp. DTU_2021_1001937_2_SI_NGA_ILE_001]|uniref:CsiV family protein n=1 Tax=Pseudomonas sp. DTU_2021_1001937_2_SI_NGA_ILE_001 TaxID=3077589 RepID=UPI0028FC2D93|nr:CsiV family protein [Pseudomonas sp. DTU_2021_1001937_2_SI_NGA_ILE_001]WNW10872.1 CsiV family protein [Pseudomonas sp. DTU_2021_1001937_2_SI_NGA_ILE_001]